MLRDLCARPEAKLGSSMHLAIRKTPVVSYGTLQVMFARFDCQSVRLGADNGPIDYAAATAEPCFGEKIPWMFRNVQEARNSFEYQETQCHRFFRQIEYHQMNDLAFELERRRRLNNINNWYSVFEQFVETSASKLSATQFQAMRMLQTRYFVLLDTLSVMDLTNEMTWDEHIDLHVRITDLAAAVSGDTTYNNTLNGKAVPVFSLDNGIAGPLFHVIRRCRDPWIRRKALSIWRATPRQEGLWDGFLALKVAERMMYLEEDGLESVRCCADIPRCSRIAALGFEMHRQEKRGDVFFSKGSSFQENSIRDPNSIIHEILIWH